MITRYRKIKECLRPSKRDCRACIFSYNPGLFDGGCKLPFMSKEEAIEQLRQDLEKENITLAEWKRKYEKHN